MEFDCLDISVCNGFDWDDGNITKNESKHNLKANEIEELFFNEPLLVIEDFNHSKDECRCNALGYINNGLKLFVAFTKRGNKIRVISARPMKKRREKIMKTLKPIPKFKNEDEEYEFWQKVDTTEYLDWSKAKIVTFPNLKKSNKTISLRLPADMLDHLKVKANAIDGPYQSYIKMILAKELAAS